MDGLIIRALASGTGIIAAGTWIHGGHEHEIGRICMVAVHTRNGNFLVFQRLAKCVKCAPCKLRQLIQEQDPSVCE